MQATFAGADKADVPGPLHQGILSLFRDDPWLAFDLLGKERPVNGTPLDRRAEVEVELPGHERERVNIRYPDLVLVWRDEQDRRRGVVICVEAQKDADWGKRYRIPVYQALLADDHELPAWVVVVSFSAQMSAALKEWSEGPPPRVDALVLDVSVVAPPASLAAAKARPTAAVLAAALHGYEGKLDVARLGVAACADLPEKKQRQYIAIILAALPVRARDTLKTELPMYEDDELWEIERQSGTFNAGLQEGLEKGLEKGRRVTLIELIFTVLDLRGIAVDAHSAAHIRACEALATLEGWARRAREIGRVQELFAEG